MTADMNRRDFLSKATLAGSAILLDPAKRTPSPKTFAPRIFSPFYSFFYKHDFATPRLCEKVKK